MTKAKPDHAGPILAALITDLADGEERRRQSLESRGSSVITVSGALVPLSSDWPPW